MLVGDGGAIKGIFGGRASYNHVDLLILEQDTFDTYNGLLRGCEDDTMPARRKVKERRKGVKQLLVFVQRIDHVKEHIERANMRR